MTVLTIPMAIALAFITYRIGSIIGYEEGYLNGTLEQMAKQKKREAIIDMKWQEYKKAKGVK